MPPKKVAKRKPRKSVPLANQNQRNQQQTKVTVNLAGTAVKAKARRRRKGVARVAQPTSNIVNVSPSFAPAFQPSFAPQPYFAPPIGASAGFGLSSPPVTESLGVPITLGDGELGVPTFGGDARESIGARNDLITQPATVSGNYDPYSQATTVRPRMPDIIVQRPSQPVSQITTSPIGSVSFTEPETSKAIITQPPSVAPTFASTVAGAFSNFKNSPAVSQFINAPPKKAKPVSPPVTAPPSVIPKPPPDRFIPARPPPPPQNTIASGYLSDLTSSTISPSLPPSLAPSLNAVFPASSIVAGGDNPLFVNRQRDTQDAFSVESQRSFATPILSDKSTSAKSGRFKLADENVDGVFNMGDLYSVGETEFLFSNELDPPLTPFSPMTRDVLTPPVNVIGAKRGVGAKRGGAMSDSDSSKSARGFNIVPSEERATVGRRMTPINEKKAVPSRYERMSLGQLQGIATNLGVDTTKKGARGQPKNRTRAELIAGITAL